MINNLLKDRKPGFYLAVVTALAAILGAVAYLVIYMVTAGDAVDRVFNWLTLGLVLAGGLLGIVTEIFRFRFGPVLAAACFSVAFANHAVEFAYPLADKLTGVLFFGGNYPLALAFTIVFGLVAVCQVVSAFMVHNVKK